MERRFEGKSFMITGAGTGFGAELSVRAAQEGAAKVLIHYRRSSAGAEQTAERVRGAGKRQQQYCCECPDGQAERNVLGSVYVVSHMWVASCVSTGDRRHDPRMFPESHSIVVGLPEGDDAPCAFP